MINVANTSKAYSEVYSFLNTLGVEYISKIPNNIYTIIEEFRDKEFHPQYSIDQKVTSDTFSKEALALIELKNYDCILWDKECGCKAYGARPVQCSTYPFWSWILKDKDSWNNESKSCPGINKGKIWSKESIEKECSNYVANVPITR